MNIDLHTHSILSHDGGIHEAEYQDILQKHILDYVAITDHDTISFAQTTQKRLGNQIIVGEEITTQQGHVIGLFLKQELLKGKDIQQTIAEIKKQKGLVYIPHPFDLVRKGIGKKTLLAILPSIDIIEIFNARVFLRWQNNQAIIFAQQNNIPGTCGSDAHGKQALGKTYTTIPSLSKISSATLISQLSLPVTYHMQYASFLEYFYPKYNKIKKYVLG